MISVFSYKSLDVEDILKIVSGLKTEKNTGEDNISAKILKAYALSFSPALSNLVNLSFAGGAFPSRFKEAQEMSLYKKKNRLNKENYHSSLKYMYTRGSCMISCQNIVIRSLIHSWLRSGKVLDVRLLCCDCWKTGKSFGQP